MNETHTAPITAGASMSMAARSIPALADQASRDLVYLLAVLGMSIVGFSVWVDGVPLSVSLLVLVIGFAVWLGTVHVVRVTVAIDRRLAGWLRREPIPAVYRTPAERGLFARVRVVTLDRQTWKDFGWIVLNSILGFALATVALTITAVVLAYILMPAWWWAVSDPQRWHGTVNLGLYTVTSTGWAFVTTALGVILIPVALAVNRGAAAGHAALAARILGTSRHEQLDARVKELASTRADVVKATNEQLERIERDLHDGAQSRLVALGMELGMAEEELTDDPDHARATLHRARDEVLTALGELRSLSRGLRPALLQDRGLQTAVDDLARRAPLPVTVTIGGDIEHVPATVQTATYFVVAEALTNVAKHSGAARARVSITHTEGALIATICDDGRGGADADAPGLAGLRKRVRALDGSLQVTSPPGGPTTLRTEIPCA